jgi:high-affinity nickel permease
MALVSSLLAGGAIGVTHALESDHLAAVATLVEEDTDRPGLVGASWGVGHTIPIAAIGLAFVVLGLQLPESVTRLFEVGVAIVLVALGARLLLGVVRETDRFTHTHGGDGHSHTHVGLGDWSLGLSHGHARGESFAVGVLHGVAGSGALVVALTAAAPSIESAITFLGGFGALSVLTMAGVSIAWGQALSRTRRRQLKALAGLVGVAVGASLFGEIVFGVTTPL